MNQKRNKSHKIITSDEKNEKCCFNQPGGRRNYVATTNIDTTRACPTFQLVCLCIILQNVNHRTRNHKEKNTREDKRTQIEIFFKSSDFIVYHMLYMCSIPICTEKCTSL